MGPLPNPKARPPKLSDAEREAQDRLDTLSMERFRGGDMKAFEGLLQRHRTGVYNFCLRMLGDRTAAEDATQEVFLRVVKGASSWSKTAKVTTWLYRIARNHCIDEIRKAKHRKTTPLDAPVGGPDGGAVSDFVVDERALPPDRGADSERMRKKILDAIAELPDDRREVFVMREYAGMPFKEIGEIVGANENTVKSRMRYALEELRAKLLEAGITPPEAP